MRVIHVSTSVHFKVMSPEEIEEHHKNLIQNIWFRIQIRIWNFSNIRHVYEPLHRVAQCYNMKCDIAVTDDEITVCATKLRTARQLTCFISKDILQNVDTSVCLSDSEHRGNTEGQ